MKLVDIETIRLPKGFFEEVNNVPKFYEWLDGLPTIEAVLRSRIDLQELEDRFGKYVRFVVEDMMSGEGKRWKNDNRL